ncbi:MAG: response regulator [Deltaproteobacteria bacterium]|nr:response regulator [Deltaproteobacteria bacterium]
MATKASFRRLQHADLWHFCSNCENWPNSGYEEKDNGDPPLDRLCSGCVEKQREGKCQWFTVTRTTTPPPPKKILIIEDHPNVRRVLTITLGHLGYETLQAADGCTGIKMSLAENPDLILLDISLPDSSGFETARTIKENPKTNQIPIVACSGWNREEIVTQGLESGIVEFLAKPISPEVLVEVIKRLT